MYTNKEKSYCDYLFQSIVIMIIPIFLSYHILANKTLFTPLTILSFFIAMVRLIFACNNSLRFEKKYLVLAGSLMFCQFMGIVGSNFRGGSLLIDDLVNTIAKPFMLLVTSKNLY